MKSKHIKLSIKILTACLITYFLFAFLPYVGRVYVSDETKHTFSMDNFHGQYTSPERVMLLEQPQEAFFHRVHLISKAQEQILLASFAFRRGETSDIIVGALLDAADRGVNVTILNNAVGGLMPRRYRDVLAAHENISVYLFNRPRFFEPQFINASMHDKYMVIDDTFLILGGRNIGDRDYAPYGHNRHVSLDREVLVYSTDPSFRGSIADVQEYFFSKINSNRVDLHTSRGNRGRGYLQAMFDNWHFLNANVPFDYYLNTIATNRITLITNPAEDAKKESIVAYNLMMLSMNSDRVIVQSPYIALTRRNLNTFLQTAQDRDFTLLTNSLASTPNLPSFSAYTADRRRIINSMAVYEFQCTQTSIHAKTFLFDDRLTAIGSFNINERSIRSDTESMLIIDSYEFNAITRDAINSLMAQSLRVGEDGEQARVPFGKRMLYTVAGHLLRPIRILF